MTTANLPDMNLTTTAVEADLPAQSDTPLFHCPTCGAEFDTRHTTEWTHCPLCGCHGRHDCAGHVDRDERSARAAAFVRQPLTKGQVWANKTYVYETTTTPPPVCAARGAPVGNQNAKGGRI